MKIETPNNIEVLLHYYVAGFEIHPRQFAPAVEQATRMFLARELIVPRADQGYNVTPSGEQVIKALCSVQI